MAQVNDKQHVQYVRIEHIKGALDVEIHAGKVNEISGPCGAGKSSVLDAIQWALGGARSVASRPITNGFETATVVVETEDYEILRVFEQDKVPYLRVKGKHGGTFGQTDLNKLLSMMTFDPTDFRGWKPAKQCQVFRELAGPNWVAELEALDKQEKALVEERLILGRIATAAGDLSTVEPGPPGAAKPEAMERQGISQELERAQTHNKEQDHRRQATRTLTSKIATLKEDITSLQRQLIRAEEELAGLAPVEEEIDTAQILHRLEELNAAATEWKVWEEKHAEWERKVSAWNKTVDDHGAAEAKISELRLKRLEHMRDTGIPIPGLTMEDGELALHGVPVNQLSSGEMIQLSAQIMMGMNPTMRIMFVQHGEALDTQMFQELVRMADEHDIQLWIATVHDDGKGHGDAIHIHEGRVVPP